jgi:hypothetical protein
MKTSGLACRYCEALWPEGVDGHTCPFCRVCYATCSASSLPEIRLEKEQRRKDYDAYRVAMLTDSLAEYYGPEKITHFAERWIYENAPRRFVCLCGRMLTNNEEEIEQHVSTCIPLRKKVCEVPV